MTATVWYAMNRAGRAEIARHLEACDARFVPVLSTRVDIGAYAAKLADRAERFEAWSEDQLIGLVAAYCNDQSDGAAYVSDVSVLQSRGGEGIASRLLRDCIEYAKLAGMQDLQLDVGSENRAALQLYRKLGFAVLEASSSSVHMILDLGVTTREHS